MRQGKQSQAIGKRNMMLLMKYMIRLEHVENAHLIQAGYAALTTA
jgi:hypothetical protein